MITNLNSTEISDVYKESDSKRFDDASLLLERHGLIDIEDNSHNYG